MTIVLKPCPFCGTEYLTIYVNRMDVSYIKCDNHMCNGQVSIDCTRCSDPLVGSLIDALVEKWNQRKQGRQ